jgi:hypothetical protein
VRMVIEGFRYDVEGYRLRFRLTKKKILLIVALATLAVALGVGMAHADPEIWPTFWMGGKSPTVT